MRKRTIKKYGNTYVIPLSRNDMDDLGLKEGDDVDIEDIIKLNGKKK